MSAAKEDWVEDVDIVDKVRFRSWYLVGCCGLTGKVATDLADEIDVRRLGSACACVVRILVGEVDMETSGGDEDNWAADDVDVTVRGVRV